MKTILKYLLTCLVILLLSSCGTRKAAINNYKANVITKEQTAIKIDSTSKVNERVKEKELVKQAEQVDITQKDVTTQVKEVFNLNGSLVERTTTTTVSDKIDRTTKQAEANREKQTNTIQEVAKQVEQTAKKVVDSLIKEHHKEVVNKKGLGAWWILIVGVVVVAVWYWFKRSI